VKARIQNTAVSLAQGTCYDAMSLSLPPFPGVQTTKRASIAGAGAFRGTGDDLAHPVTILLSGSACFVGPGSVRSGRVVSLLPVRPALRGGRAGSPPSVPRALRASHSSHACSLCMRPDHFADRLVPVWGCGEHTKLPIMARRAPALAIPPAAYAEIPGTGTADR
jgi:hypothetical protein